MSVNPLLEKLIAERQKNEKLLAENTKLRHALLAAAQQNLPAWVVSDLVDEMMALCEEVIAETRIRGHFGAVQLGEWQDRFERLTGRKVTDSPVEDDSVPF